MKRNQKRKRKNKINNNNKMRKKKKKLQDEVKQEQGYLETILKKQGRSAGIKKEEKKEGEAVVVVFVPC